MSHHHHEQAISSAINPPVKEYNFFLRSLVAAIRSNIADCARAAYTTINLADATRMLMFKHDRVSICQSLLLLLVVHDNRLLSKDCFC